MLRSSARRITRRRLIGSTLAAGSLVSSFGIPTAISQSRGLFLVPPLPYREDALVPVISSSTVSFHYGKHHKAYVDNLNKAIEGTEWKDKSLEEIVRAAFGDHRRAAIFVNAAQAWNHAFYWNSMQPSGGGAPAGTIADRMKDSFGDYFRFRQEFTTAAATQLGSGWVWLVQSQGKKLVVLKTANADTPMVRGTTCLLTCDIWEHAYYLDYQNRRLDYVNAWLDKLVNWEFAAQQLAG
jgi:superoxide dismutase, Fe-Mn family